MNFCAGRTLVPDEFERDAFFGTGYNLFLVTEQHNKRVVVGMSGGVDSSVAAALLLDQGYDVIGLTLKVWPDECMNRSEKLCCGPHAIVDARRVAHTLGIQHYVVNAVEDFQKSVIQKFAAEYRAGRTPNPCIVCNETTKFGALARTALQLDATHVATGHYARLDRLDPGGRVLLRKGRDPRKEQSYFLFSLSQEMLARTLFPLAEMTKQETRDAARQRNLVTADKKESMEICFVPNNDYRHFLTTTGLAQKHQGEIVNQQGQVLGYHEGIEFYTIGQRKGLRLSAPQPLYVISLDAVNNRVVVGDNAALDRDEFVVDRCNWIRDETPPEEFEALAKIRYHHTATPATVTLLPDGRARVKLHIAQRAITPGQACVFYQDDLVIGGGWITLE
jgi:tRNA-uridine 2-sulfurtransferase